MQAYRIFRAHSTDDKEKENVKIENRRGPPLRTTLGRKDAVQDRKFSPSIVGKPNVWKMAFDLLSVIRQLSRPSPRFSL